MSEVKLGDLSFQSKMCLICFFYRKATKLLTEGRGDKAVNELHVGLVTLHNIWLLDEFVIFRRVGDQQGILFFTLLGGSKGLLVYSLSFRLLVCLLKFF